MRLMTQIRIAKIRYQNGISILEILLALAIVAAVTIYLTRMVGFVESGNKVDDSFDRMTKIVQQTKAYYLSQEALPAPVGSPLDDVPVDLQQLNLSQKHRLDAWGQYFIYIRASTITGFQVNGREAAGILISLGPNQTKDYDDSVIDVYTSGGDDLLVPITVASEAWQIVMTELEMLDKLVMAYDRVFAGIDNDAGDTTTDGGYIYFPPSTANIGPYTVNFSDPSDDRSFFLIDESGCVRADPAGCASGLPITNITNDPNCGRATIDDCANPVNAILTRYDLSDPSYQTDPWGNPYQWGLGDGVSPSSLSQSDRRYHVFYSMGPDGVTHPDESNANSLDDIVPY